MDSASKLETAASVLSDVDGLFAALLPYGLNLLSAVAILIVGFWSAGFLAGLVRRQFESVEHFDATLVPVFAQLTRYAVIILTIVLVLGQFGVQTASIIAVIGAAGLAIGLALQGTLQNVAAGIMLLILRPFRVGDHIDAAGQSGTVSEIGLFATQMNTAQNVFISLPNAKVFGDAIVNYSRNDTRRADVAVGVAYGTDIEKAKQVLLTAIAREPRAHQLPAPQIAVLNLGESAVDLEARVWFARADFLSGSFDLRVALKAALDEAGIEIPFPHRQVIITDGGKSQPRIETGKKSVTRKRSS